MAYIDPNVLLGGEKFTPFTSYQQGSEFAQKRRANEQLQQMRAQQMGLAGLRAEQESKMLPLELEAKTLQNELARTTNPLKIQQIEGALSDLEYERERSQGLRGLGAQFGAGEIGEDEFLKDYRGLYPETIPGAIQQKKATELAVKKLDLERKDKEFEQNIKLSRLKTDQQKFDFDKLKFQFELDKPFREEGINQGFLSSELSANLAAKRNPKVRLTANKIKDVTVRSVKTPQVFRIIGDIKTDIGEFGIERMPSEAKNRMTSNLRILQGILKSPEFINLGVLTGPDLEFLEDITGDPTGFFNLSSNNVLTRIGALEKNTVQEFNTAMVGNGFKPFTIDEIKGLIPDVSGRAGSEVGGTKSVGGGVSVDPVSGKVYIEE